MDYPSSADNIFISLVEDLTEMIFYDISESKKKLLMQKMKAKFNMFKITVIKSNNPIDIEGYKPYLEELENLFMR